MATTNPFEDPRSSDHPTLGVATASEVSVVEAENKLDDAIAILTGAGLRPNRLLMSLGMYRALLLEGTGQLCHRGRYYKVSVTSTNPGAVFCVAFAEGY